MTPNNTAKKPVVIGVTGNSGSGKSSVCGILREKGAFIIDADKIAHDIIKRCGPAYDEVIEAFGREILDAAGEIDRGRLGSVVFADAEKRDVLVDITHKHILKEMLELKDKAAWDGRALIVMDAPLLIEAGLHNDCDAVWVVRANRAQRIARIMRRDGLTRRAAQARLAAQTPFGELAQYATAIIDNDGEENLEAQIDKALAKLLVFVP